MTQVRYWAAAKEAAGRAEDDVRATTLAEALAQVRALHPGRLEQVLERCSFLVDGDPVGSRRHVDVPVGAGSLVDCLPPFAGG
jgi:molybdopterin synthase sulfur carrier subunit